MNVWSDVVDMLIPQFVTKPVAAMLIPDVGYQLLGEIRDLDPDESYDAVLSVSCFTWMGRVFRPRVQGVIE